MSKLPESQSRNAEERIISIVRLQNLIGNVSTRELVYILNTYYMRKLKKGPSVLSKGHSGLRHYILQRYT